MEYSNENISCVVEYNLPSDIWKEILSGIEVKDIYSFSLLSKYHRKITLEYINSNIRKFIVKSQDAARYIANKEFHDISKSYTVANLGTLIKNNDDLYSLFNVVVLREEIIEWIKNKCSWNDGFSDFLNNIPAIPLLVPEHLPVQISRSFLLMQERKENIERWIEFIPITINDIFFIFASCCDLCELILRDKRRKRDFEETVITIIMSISPFIPDVDLNTTREDPKKYIFNVLVLTSHSLLHLLEKKLIRINRIFVDKLKQKFDEFPIESRKGLIISPIYDVIFRYFNIKVNI